MSHDLSASRGEMALSMMLQAISVTILSGDAPQELRDNPNLVGQSLQEVVGGCAVYLMPCKEHGSEYRYIKIGWARNIKKRISTVSVGCPHGIKKAMYFCTASQAMASDLEKKLHTEFAEFNSAGEWFRFDGAEELEAQTKKIIHFVQDYLQEDYNQYVYVAGQEESQLVRGYLEKLYDRVTEIVYGVDMQGIFSGLSPTSSFPTA